MLNTILKKSKLKIFTIQAEGQIRWLFPSTLKSPTFLNLYNSNTIKGQLFKIIVRLAFKLNCQHFLTKKIIYKTANNKLSKILYSLSCTNYSIFTGTPGCNRKITIEANNGSETKHFIKIPYTKNSIIQIQSEKKKLEYVKQLNCSSFSVPFLTYDSFPIIAVSNIKPSQIVKAPFICNIHIEALFELYSKTKSTKDISTLSVFKETKEHINKLEKIVFNKKNIFHQKAKAIVPLLSQLQVIVETHSQIEVSFSHQDFTPWNMYVTKNHLYIYDWELAKDHIPLLFDFFHFQFQTFILIYNLPYKNIKKLLQKNCDSKLVKTITTIYNLDINIYIQYYLLINVSYYMLQYCQQKDLHLQAYRLAEIWQDALEDSIKNFGVINDV
jgi:hypothetical protein